MIDSNVTRSPAQDLSCRGVAAIIALFTLFSLASDFMFPVFEAPDEDSHFQYARLIAQCKGLPVQTDRQRQSYAEGFNPPLYYLVPALILAITDPGRGGGLTTPGGMPPLRILDLANTPNILPPMNPQFRALGQGHDPTWFRHPAGGPFAPGPLMSVHLMRIFSVLCGAGTLFGIWLFSRQVLPGRAYGQLAAMTVVAFNPQFVYLSSVLNSDNLVATIATFTMACLASILHGNRNTTGKSVALGALFGLGMLAKPNMAVLALPAVWVLWVRRTSIDSFVRRVVMVGLIALCICGWFFARNAWLYGSTDFFGYQAREALFPAFNTSKGAFWTFLAGDFAPLLFLSYWGLFGWSTIPLHPWQYVLYFVLGSTTMLSFFGRSRDPESVNTQTITFLWLTIGMNLLALVAFNLRFRSYHGRLLFPTLASQAALVALGIELLWSRRSRTTQVVCGTALAGTLAAIVIYVYFSIVRPLYLVGVGVLG